MPGRDDDGGGLTRGARSLLEAAERIREKADHEELCTNHLRLAVLEKYPATVSKMMKGLCPVTLARRLAESLLKGETGPIRTQRDVIRDAWAHSGRRGKKKIEAFDMVATLLRDAGHLVDEYEILEGTREADVAGTAGSGGPPYIPRAKKPTPSLESMGTDLTKEALEGRITPVAGREEEIASVILTLCRRTKKNPILLGEPGVGKTAIVEGLAEKVARGDVPDPLRNVRIVSLSINAITAGTKYVGTIQDKIENILKEARQDGIVLFLDEVHNIVAGAGENNLHSIADSLKPVLARGDVAIIAATTDDEYRKHIEPDSALERRFQPITVHPLSLELSRQALEKHVEDFRRLRSVDVPDEVLDRILYYSVRFMRNRFLPDKAIDLLEGCVADAVMTGKREVSPECVSRVVERMVGMPMDERDAGKRLDAMKERITRLSLLPETDAESLRCRLEAAIRGMNLQPHRPNAVVLLAGDAADCGSFLGETIAREFYGGKDRMVAIDFGRFQRPEDVSGLLGTSQGYVGYRESVPLHQVKKIPWCVVLFENIDSAHPSAVGILERALLEGYFTDGGGRRICLSDAVIVLTAMRKDGARRSPGFHDGEESGGIRVDALRERVGKEILSACHLVVTGKAPGFANAGRFRVEECLSELARQAGRRGMILTWEPSIPEALAIELSFGNGLKTAEQVVEERVVPLLMEACPSEFQGMELRLYLDETGIKVGGIQEVNMKQLLV